MNSRTRKIVIGGSILALAAGGAGVAMATSVDGDRDQRREQQGADQALLVERPDVPQPERDVREEVDRGPAQQGHGRHGLQRVLYVAQGFLQAERAQHDAGHHREVKVRIGVARDLVALPALATVALLAAILVALITYEAVRFAELRDRIRHQLAREAPGA